jgi:hypothetical protein
MRQKYENTNAIFYDLVIVTRPDIMFYRPLDLTPFFEKRECWQFYDAETLRKYVFSTYINGIYSVIRPDKYVAGLDLVLMAVPTVCDKLAEWEGEFDHMIDQWPEFALICMMNRHGLRHSYFTYEKDKCWTIVRLGAKKPTIVNKIVDILYRSIVPLLLKSRLFCQHTYTNVTTTPNLREFKSYLRGHLGIHPFGESLFNAWVGLRNLMRRYLHIKC